MNKREIRLEASWLALMKEEFSKSYFDDIRIFLKAEIDQGKVLYPPSKLIFNAFNSCPVDKVKVVIIGQDPYHGPNQAMGLSFSVPRTERTPPSLKNIFKELNSDLNTAIPDHGDLTSWSEEGVFLLNAMLTVEHKKPGSHKKIGWQNFTDAVITKLSEKRNHLVFMLWGNYAKGKNILIDTKKHLVLEAPHPSPLARGGFFGCKHFSKANVYLTKNGKKPVNWKL